MKKTKVCKVDGCERKMNTKGFCQMHYQRNKRHGDSNANFKKLRGKCGVDNCDKGHYVHGYCVNHSRRFLKYGDPLKTIQNVDHNGFCSIDGCRGVYASNGLCIDHYNDMYRLSPHGKIARSAGNNRARTLLRNAEINDFTGDQWKNCLIHFDNKCAYCDKEHKGMNMEHVVPISKGGNNTKSNIVPACKSCNSRKNTKEVYEWYRNDISYDEQREQKIIEYLKQDELVKI